MIIHDLQSAQSSTEANSITKSKNMSIADYVSQYSSFSFYGAQVVAYGAFSAIHALTNRKPLCFIVSSLANNPQRIEDIPVTTVEAVPTDTLIIIAVTELLQDEIMAALAEQGYNNTFRLTAHEEHLLMSRYFASIGKFPLIETITNNTPSFTLYEAHSKRDKPLASPPMLKSWETPIQADAEITGNNINSRNHKYCEMSAAYWIWKHATDEWVGLEHYRRHLFVTPNMLSDNIDVILPLPYICYPNTMTHFRRFVSDDVANALLQTIQTLCSQKYEQYLQILHGKYQYICNLIVAKRAVYSDYCAWFFNITQYMETLGVPDIAKTRALSYVAEILTNLYFMSNSDSLRVRHVEKAIYT
ncbi:MAG: DUF4422 domain-containing protein [Synergistaceae bacterium]|jgi:hypothetical protein|nr:DUF4422 domain-containing protein [Synergistaceae bacterium]